MSRILDDNVHILLSSFAVRGVENRLINMTIFIEGGSPLVIRAFAKNNAYPKDVNYQRSVKLFSQQSIMYKQHMKTDNFEAEYITDNAKLAVSMNSVFEVKSKEGARFTQAIDVCLDYEIGHSKAMRC